MLLVFAVLSLLLGAVLVWSGRNARRAARETPAPLPTAKIEDGRALDAPRPPSGGTGLVVAGVVVMILGPLVFGVLYVLSEAFSGLSYQMGRPLRRRRRAVLPRIALGAYACDAVTPAIAGSRWRCARAGVRWLAAARHEHASVPAFEQLADQVAALGGAPALRARCLAAAGDERRHATRCYTLARAYTGLAWRPGALRVAAPEAADPVAIAVASYRDGALGEEIAAEMAAAGAARADDPVIADTLATIARDEQRHADLAWDVLALCVERGGEAVRAALVAAAREDVAVPAPGPTELPRAEVRAIAGRVEAAARERLARL